MNGDVSAISAMTRMKELRGILWKIRSPSCGEPLITTVAGLRGYLEQFQRDAECEKWLCIDPSCCCLLCELGFVARMLQDALGTMITVVNLPRSTRITLT